MAEKERNLIILFHVRVLQPSLSKHTIYNIMHLNHQHTRLNNPFRENIAAAFSEFDRPLAHKMIRNLKMPFTCNPLKRPPGRIHSVAN
jgi:hypothetical protein